MAYTSRESLKNTDVTSITSISALITNLAHPFWPVTHHHKTSKQPFSSGGWTQTPSRFCVKMPGCSRKKVLSNWQEGVDHWVQGEKFKYQYGHHFTLYINPVRPSCDLFRNKNFVTNIVSMITNVIFPAVCIHQVQIGNWIYLWRCFISTMLLSKNAKLKNLCIC